MTAAQQFGLYGIIIAAIVAFVLWRARWMGLVVLAGLALFGAWTVTNYIYMRFGMYGFFAAFAVIGVVVIGAAYVKISEITPVKNHPAEIVTKHKDPGFLDEGGLYSWTKGINS